MGILKLFGFAVVAGMIGVFIIQPIAGFWAALAFSGVCGVVSGALLSSEAARLPDPNEGDQDCPKAAECRMCPCGFCAALRGDE